MSNKERWLSGAALLVSILPFILVAGSMQLLPDGDIVLSLLNHREELYINKYQYLYLGLIGFIPAVLVVFARILKARDLVERNFKYMVISALLLGVMFLFVTVYGMIDNIIRYDIDLLMTFEFFGGSVTVVSLIGGMLANFLPSLRRNDFVGLKNRYTLGDNRVWLKVHYVAADVYMSVLFGFAVFSPALGIWLDFKYGWIHLVLWVATMTALIVWGRVYSRIVSRRITRHCADCAESRMAER